jgi:hypothetical protein
MKNEAKKVPGLIANITVAKLREQGLDCVNPDAYGNATGKIHDAIFYAAKDVLDTDSIHFIQEETYGTTPSDPIGEIVPTRALPVPQKAVVRSELGIIVEDNDGKPAMLNRVVVNGVSFIPEQDAAALIDRLEEILTDGLDPECNAFDKWSGHIAAIKALAAVKEWREHGIS